MYVFQCIPLALVSPSQILDFWGDRTWLAQSGLVSKVEGLFNTNRVTEGHHYVCVPLAPRGILFVLGSHPLIIMLVYTMLVSSCSCKANHPTLSGFSWEVWSWLLNPGEEGRDASILSLSTWMPVKSGPVCWEPQGHFCFKSWVLLGNLRSFQKECVLKASVSSHNQGGLRKRMRKGYPEKRVAPGSQTRTISGYLSFCCLAPGWGLIICHQAEKAEL